MKTRRENNREKMRENNRRWRENNPEKVSESNRRYYLNNREKECERRRQYYLNNREKVRERDRQRYLNNREKVREDHLRKKYGLTLADFEALTRKQNSLCLICKKKGKKNLSVDHCHKTGRVRGLLCEKCNQGLGCFSDDFSTLIRAANYVGWRSN